MANVTEVLSITALRALTGSANQTIELLYHTNINDGGGGVFYWRVTPTLAGDDNGGTIVVVSGVTSGRWERVYSGAIYTSWFGLIDGNDETAKLKSIFELIENGTTVIFKKGQYKFDDKLSVSGQNDFIIDFGGAELYDMGLTGQTNTSNAPIVVPHGIQFSNCEHFTVRNLYSNSNVSGSGEIRPLDQPLRVPLIDFDSCNYFELSGIKMQGYTGAHITVVNSSNAKEVMAAYHLRFYNCLAPTVLNCEILSGAHGEYFGFNECEGIVWGYCKHIQGASAQTFSSFGKIINCKKTTVLPHFVQSTSPGSFIDFCGDGLVMEGLNIDYPNGKLIDFPGEWLTYFTEAKNVLVKDCVTNGGGIFYSGGTETTVPAFQNIVFDNVQIASETLPSMLSYWNSLNMLTNGKFKNIAWKNQGPLIAYQKPNGIRDFSKTLLIEDFSIAVDSTVSFSNVVFNVPGELTLLRGEVDLNGKGIVFYDNYSEEHAVTLLNSPYKTVIKNVNFRNAAISIFCNLEFIDCNF